MRPACAITRLLKETAHTPRGVCELDFMDPMSHSTGFIGISHGFVILGMDVVFQLECGVNPIRHDLF